MRTTCRALSVALALACPLGAAPMPTDRQAPPRGVHTRFAPPVFTTRAAWEARRVELRAQLLNAAGLLPLPERPPLVPHVTAHVERDGYTIDNVWFETRPGLVLGGNLYRPTVRPAGRLPAVLTPHGHMEHGRLHHDEIFSPPARSISLARFGCVVFSYDMTGYNDTGLGLVHRGFALDAQSPLWGLSVFGLQTWNSLRALDYLCSLPEVDPERIGITGESGGGTQTFILAGIDERIAASAPINMISLHMAGGCVCENAPGLRVRTDNVEIGALVAPKPQLLVSATGDWTVDTPKLEGPAMQACYRLYDAADKLSWVQVKAGHNSNQASREAVYAFFGRYLLGDPVAEHFREQPLTVEPADKLRALAAKPPEQLAEAPLLASLRLARTLEWQVDLPRDAAGLARFRSRWSDPLRLSLGLPTDIAPAEPTRWLNPAGSPTTLVTGGSPALLDALVASGRAVAVVEPFRFQPPRDAHADFFTGYNVTELGWQVQDLVATLRWLREHGRGPLELLGLGPQGLRALLARAFVPAVARTLCDLDGLDPSDDQAWLGDLWVPGLRRAGDVRTAALLAAPGDLWLAGSRRCDTTVVEQLYAGLGAAADLKTTRIAPATTAVLKWLALPRQ